MLSNANCSVKFGFYDALPPRASNKIQPKVSPEFSGPEFKLPNETVTRFY